MEHLKFAAKVLLVVAIATRVPQIGSIVFNTNA
jgi:hypothetical protein